MAEPAALLEVRDLVKRYDTGAGAVSVLEGVSLQVPAGDSLAIVGPSGSGKSTLLQIMGTLDQPTGGEVRLEGQNLLALEEAGLARVRSSKLGFVFQSHYLLPQCTTWENVLIPTLASVPSHDAAGAAEQRAERLLQRVGLGKRMTHFPGQLSGGECQRVAVVRALINNPNLVLADEPTGSLDQASAESLAQLLVDLNQEEGVTLIVVTHSLDLAGRMKRTLRLEGGMLQETDA